MTRTESPIRRRTGKAWSIALAAAAAALGLCAAGTWVGLSGPMSNPRMGKAGWSGRWQWFRQDSATQSLLFFGIPGLPAGTPKFQGGDRPPYWSAVGRDGTLPRVLGADTEAFDEWAVGFPFRFIVYINPATVKNLPDGSRDTYRHPGPGPNRRISGTGMALNAAFVLACALAAALVHRGWSSWVAFRRWGYCQNCGYNLRGLQPGAVCPECGTRGSGVAPAARSRRACGNATSLNSSNHASTSRIAWTRRMRRAELAVCLGQ